MIGKVNFEWQGDKAEAVLGDDGRWTTADPVLQDDLNSDLAADAATYSPADGQRGYWQLAEAARRLDGKVEAPEIGPGTPGMVY